jgi:hypothetical protein
MKKLNLVVVTLAISALLLLAVSASAQVIGKAEAGERAGTKSARAKAAVVAVKKDDRVEFATDKARLLAYVQKVFKNTKERGVVTDISLRSFEKEQYLAVKLKEQGTLFLHLEPTGSGIQGIFVVGYDKYLYCAYEGCTSCFLDRSQGNVVCSCDTTINQGPSSGCKLKPRLYVNLVIAELNDLLLAEGLAPATGEGTETEGQPKIKRAEPSRRKN